MSISSPDGKDPLPSFPDGRHHPFSILSPAPGYLPVQHRLCGDAIIPEKKKKSWNQDISQKSLVSFICSLLTATCFQMARTHSQLGWETAWLSDFFFNTQVGDRLGSQGQKQSVQILTEGFNPREVPQPQAWQNSRDLNNVPGHVVTLGVSWAGLGAELDPGGFYHTQWFWIAPVLWEDGEKGDFGALPQEPHPQQACLLSLWSRAESLITGEDKEPSLLSEACRERLGLYQLR